MTGIDYSWHLVAIVVQMAILTVQLGRIATHLKRIADKK